LNTKRGIEIGNSDKFESYLKNIFLTNIFWQNYIFYDFDLEKKEIIHWWHQKSMRWLNYIKLNMIENEDFVFFVLLWWMFDSPGNNDVQRDVHHLNTLTWKRVKSCTLQFDQFI
jgi:hypothetical protein